MKQRKRFAVVIGVAAVGVMALGAQTAQSGLADEGAASSKIKPAVQCWTTFPGAGGEAKPKVAPNHCLFAAPNAQSFEDDAIGAFGLSWKHWGAPKTVGKGKACSALRRPSPNECATVTFILTKLRYEASCQRRMYSKVRFEVKGDGTFAQRLGGCS
jgi:hypothetical protein